MDATTFPDRVQAGRFLAERLARYKGRDDVLVLALPRGGVPVAYAVAMALEAPLDVFVVRKLGVPGHEELAMGAIARGGVRVVNDDIVQSLRLSDETLDEVARIESEELRRRERAYRGARPYPDVRGRIVILVDDGLATGASVRAAAEALKQLGPARLVIAVPVGAYESCQELERISDEVVCGRMPEAFFAIGQFYDNFGQTTDDEVRALLKQAQREARMRARTVRQS